MVRKCTSHFWGWCQQQKIIACLSVLGTSLSKDQPISYFLGWYKQQDSTDFRVILITSTAYRVILCFPQFPLVVVIKRTPVLKTDPRLHGLSLLRLINAIHSRTPLFKDQPHSWMVRLVNVLGGGGSNEGGMLVTLSKLGGRVYWGESSPAWMPCRESSDFIFLPRFDNHPSRVGLNSLLCFLFFCSASFFLWTGKYEKEK